MELRQFPVGCCPHIVDTLTAALLLVGTGTRRGPLVMDTLTVAPLFVGTLAKAP
jgi:hypothetical protein